MNKSLTLTILLIAFCCACKKTAGPISEQTIETISKTKLVKRANEVIGAPQKTIVTKTFNPYRPYNRTAIDRVFAVAKKKRHLEGLARGKNENTMLAVFTDGYTGKRLIGGSNYEYDHIRSAEFLHSKYKSLLTDAEIAQIVNCSENITTTNAKINRAKGKQSMELLLANTSKVEQLGIHPTLVKKALLNADEGIQRKIKEIIAQRVH